MNRVEIIDFLAQMLRGHEDGQPEMTVRDLFSGLTSFPCIHWHDECRHCHKVIISFDGEDGAIPRAQNHWSHSAGNRRCFQDATSSAGRRLTAQPLSEHDSIKLDDRHGNCHICQVARELLRGRSGNGWDWSRTGELT